ncbi:MAG: DMT family transporter [Bdellovibrionales bacterium]
MSERKLGLLMACTTALSWSFLAILLKLALHFFSTGTVVWFRMLIAALLMTAWAFYKRREDLKIVLGVPFALLVAGLMIATNYFGYMKGIELTSASNAQILIQLAPMSFALLSTLMYREFPTRRQWFGLITALVGFGCFYWDQALASWDQLDRYQTGNLWIILAAATWTVFALLQKRLLKTVSSFQFNLVIYSISAFALAPTATFAEIGSAGIGPFVLLFGLGVNTIIAYGAFSEALKRIPGHQVSVIISMNPLITILVVTLMVHFQIDWIGREVIHWRGLVGALLVVSGVITTVTGSKKRRPI